MPILPTPRTALAAATALLLAPLAACSTADAPADTVSETTRATTGTSASTDKDFARIEGEFDAKLGVYAIDTGTGETVAYNANDRFAYCSTFKAFAAGAVLDMNSAEEMKEVIHYTADDLIDHSPITEQHVDTGMTLSELNDAAVRYSDNAAANLLFEELGGPGALDEALAEVGDDVTHMDRIEPELNEAAPGDIRDTTTPKAFATSLGEYTLGDALPAGKRKILNDLLRRNTTGDALIRAGVPKGWKVGDKTGGGSYGTRNDIAVLWPPKGEPVLMAIMSTRAEEDAEYKDALVAQSAKVAIEALR